MGTDTRVDKAAAAVEEARTTLEQRGETVLGLVIAARTVARARWELGELRTETPLSRTVMSAVLVVETAIAERSAEMDEGR